MLNPLCFTIVYPWCDSHSTSTKFLLSGEIRTKIQVFRRKIHPHIYLN